MRVLCITDPSPDYGADYTYDGLRCALHDVYDYPLKPSLHLKYESRTYDCDLHWPELPSQALARDPHQYRKLVEDNVRQGFFDAVFVPTLRQGAVEAIRQLASIPGWLKIPKIGYDAEDHPHNVREAYRAELGPMAAFFKRELEIASQDHAHPLPFGYPQYRGLRHMDAEDRFPVVFYAAYVWEWARNAMREKILATLTQRIPLKHRSVHVSREPSERLSVSEYHARQRRALAAIVPAGQGYWTNRYWEAVADGALVIAERFPEERLRVDPRHVLVEGEEALYFSSAEEAAELGVWAIEHSAEATVIAEKARAKFFAYNTTYARVSHMLEVAGLRP